MTAGGLLGERSRCADPALVAALVQAAAAVVPGLDAAGAAPNEAGKAGLRDTEAAEHCNTNSIYVFLFWKLRDLSPTGLPAAKLKIDTPILEIYKSLTDI